MQFFLVITQITFDTSRRSGDNEPIPLQPTRQAEFTTTFTLSNETHLHFHVCVNFVLDDNLVNCYQRQQYDNQLHPPEPAVTVVSLVVGPS